MAVPSTSQVVMVPLGPVPVAMLVSKNVVTESGTGVVSAVIAGKPDIVLCPPSVVGDQ